MKVKVIYVINGDTQSEVLEAPVITHCISHPKIGSIVLRNEKFNPIKKIYYGECDRIEVLYGDQLDSVGSPEVA